MAEGRVEIYRGYDLKEIGHGTGMGVVISKNGEAVTSQPSWEFAYKWVDKERAKAR